MDLIAVGNTAEVFRYDEDLICKLFYKNYPQVYVEHEFNNAKAVFALGLRTPQAHKMVSIDGKAGIIYDRVIGETLSSKISGKENQTMWIDQFVDFHKDMLENVIENAMNYKDFLKLFAAGSTEIIDKINGLEDGRCLLHGDFHPVNIIVDTAGNLVLIDMMNVCKGPAMYDVARTYFLLGNDEELQRMYSEKMGFQFADIAPYLEVISFIREKETGR